MGRPRRARSLDAVSSAVSGDAEHTDGHVELSMYIIARNADTSNDTLDVQLEVSLDGEEWAPIHDETGTQLMTVSISEFTDVDGDGTHAVFLSMSGVAADQARLRITSFTDAANGDLSVDGYIGMSGNAEGPASNMRDV